MQKVFLTIIIICFLSFSTEKAETYEPVVVLELFTSQGCSSCPPADTLLDQVKNDYKEEQVITLSYHVDYWDYIGWKDPFGKKAFSDKQRAYSRKFFSSTIYTPQIVVNGKEHFVGSDKRLMRNKLKRYLQEHAMNKISISDVKREKSNVFFGYEILGSLQDKSARAILVLNDKETFVKRGENRHRTLKNSNIVVAESYLNLNTKSSKLDIPDFVSDSDELRLIILVENSTLDILGGSQMIVR